MFFGELAFLRNDCMCFIGFGLRDLHRLAVGDGELVREGLMAHIPTGCYLRVTNP